MLQKLHQLKDLSKKFKRKYFKEIQDIILFGSAVKSKLNPRDIDVCIISFYRNSIIEQIVLEFGGKAGSKVHVTYVPLSEFPKHSLFKTLIHEGLSLLTGKALHESLGFEPYILFWYELSSLKQTQKVKFFYALKGRAKQNGILKEVNGKYLGKGVILVPVRFDNEMQDFFKQWHIDFNRRRLFLEK